MTTDNQEFFDDLDALGSIAECALYVHCSDLCSQFTHPALTRNPLQASRAFIAWVCETLPEHNLRRFGSQFSYHAKLFVLKHFDIVQELVAIHLHDLLHQQAGASFDPLKYTGDLIWENPQNY